MRDVPALRHDPVLVALASLESRRRGLRKLLAAPDVDTELIYRDLMLVERDIRRIERQRDDRNDGSRP